jgi:hypothetical protein
LLELQRSCPLPEGATSLDVFCQRALIGELSIELVGLTAELDGEVFAGSAAEVDVPPLDRAYFELVERLSIGRALRRDSFTLADSARTSLGVLSREEVFPTSPEPERWRHAKSNGVAIAPTWAQACARATAEAVERDCVLRAWHGELTLSSVVLPASELGAWQKFGDFVELEFRAMQWLGHWVVVVAGFPKRREVGFSIAFGARRQLGAALIAARKEFTQRFGFLFGEQIPDSAPPFSADANYHQEYSLWPGSHAAIREWLARSPNPSISCGRRAEPSPEPTGFVDLTPSELAGCASVVRAWWPDLRPLVFGVGYAGYPVTPPHPIA